METTRTVTLMSALAQPTRYRCVAMLMRQGPCTAGELASGLGVPANTMSSHLTILTHAGLISSRKEGRHVIYGVERHVVVQLIAALKSLAAD